MVETNQTQNVGEATQNIAVPKEKKRWSKMVKKGYLIIGNNPVEVAYRLDGMLCLHCKHFDIKAYERDFIVQKKHFSVDACRSLSVIFDGQGPIACGGKLRRLNVGSAVFKMRKGSRLLSRRVVLDRRLQTLRSRHNMLEMP